jgi:cellulase/cellobiase CelA1
MRRSRLRLAIYITSAVLAAGGGVGVAVAATGPSSAAGLTATFSKDSDWGAGYQGKFTVTNKGSAAVQHWSVRFTLPSSAKLGTF